MAQGIDMERDRPHPHPGFFLALDGPDGGGKTTQAERLADWLESQGLSVVLRRDPGRNRARQPAPPSASGPPYHADRSGAEMLLYQAARAELVEEVITTSLAVGKVVVTDRYPLSNIVYQGTAGGLLEEEIAMVGMIATAGVLPDLTIILDVPPEIAESRTGGARDRIEDRPHAYRAKVREGFLAAVASSTQPGADGRCP